MTMRTFGVMTAPSPEAHLDVFDDVSRGDAAPQWVRSGIVAAWDLSGDVEASLIVLSENVTFSVRVDGAAAMVVRLARPGYIVSVEHLRGELQWIEALRRDAGIPTPSPVRGGNGDLVQVLVDDLGATWSAVAFDFVAGRMLEDEQNVADHYREIGRLTAMLHEHASSWVRPESFTRFSWDLDDLVGAHARWGDWRAADLTDAECAVLEDAEKRARAVLAAHGVDRSPAHFGVIHGDLRPSNVMLTGDPFGDVALTIIDFDDCGFGYYLYDFAAALTFYEHRPEAPLMARRWIDGYTSIRPLSQDDLDVAVALSMIRRLTMLGWATTHRADALPADLWVENLPGTIEVARRFLVDERWLTRP